MHIKSEITCSLAFHILQHIKISTKSCDQIVMMINVNVK